MKSRLGANCSVMLAFGLLTCCFFAILSPHEPTVYTTSSLPNNVQLATVRVHSLTSPLSRCDAVFALDCVTGFLQGALLNGRTATFTNFYYRDVAADFGIEPGQADAEYLIVPRHRCPEVFAPRLTMSKNRMPLNSDALYVVELTSGRVHAYAFSYLEVRSKQPPVQLELIDTSDFRQPMEK